MITILSAIVCALSLLVQLYYWWMYFHKLEASDAPFDTSGNTHPMISVIIAAKDEADHLKTLIPILLDQDYPNFEILVANDHSSDDTGAILDKWEHQSNRIRQVTVTRDIPGKKQAIADAVGVSSGSWFLFTDADCRPASKHWISGMWQEAASREKEIVLGYSPYTPGRSFLSKWVHYENWLVGLLYLSFAKKGHPYMGVGRNYMIRRSLFPLAVLEDQSLAGGDDDLVINRVANGHNTAVHLAPSGFIRTFPPATWEGYCRQKRRHFSTPGQYRSTDKLRLALFSLSHFCFYLSAGILLFAGHPWAIIIVMLRWLMILPVVLKCKKTLQAGFGLAGFMLYDFLLVFFYAIFGSLFFVRKNGTW